MSSRVRLDLFHPSRFGRALRFAWDSSPRWMAASLGLVVLQAGLPLLSLYLYKLIIDTVEAGVSAGAVDLGRVAGLIALAAAGALAANWLQARAALAAEMQAQAVADYMFAVLHEKSTAVDLAYYENPAYHDTLHRAQREAARRPMQIVQGLVDISRSGLSLFLLAGLLFSFYPVVPVVLFVSALPGILLQLRYANQIYDWQQRQTQTDRQASHIHWMLTSQHNAREIRLFQLGSFFRERFGGLRRQLRHEQEQLAGYHARIEFVSQASTTLALFGAFAFMAYQTMVGLITLGTLVVAYQAFQDARRLLQGLVAAFTDFYQHNLFLENVYEFLDLEPQVTEPLHPRPVPRPMQQGIVFENVGFRYPGSDVHVLENVNLAIRPGQVVALVGENGSGKTTLVKLMCRFYDPTEGRITLDGIDLRELSMPDLRRQISVIFQDYVWYHLLTARENIWLGDVVAPADEAKIVAAARQSGADEFIRHLPQGYDNLLGSLFNTGRELSVGEWQRVALARAFYRDAQLLILDEPSSALDPLAEAEVFQRFHQLAQAQTAILVSHRLSNVRRADCIHVLAGKTVAERGSHDDLVQRNGVYRRLFQTQAQHYRA
jgi:ATP-binding cassette subfamily B protein